MEVSISRLQLQSASPSSHDTNISKAGFRFLSLPPEIRLIIYKELLVQSDGLHRTFCMCEYCPNLKSRSVGRDHLNPSLLRTNKAIYNEALPVLYSNNTFAFLCYGSFTHRDSLNIYRRRRGRRRIMTRAGDDGLKTGHIAYRHAPWTGVARVIACPSDAAKLDVRKVVIQLDCMLHTIPDSFPSQWWQPMERDVLRHLPGLEQIVIQPSWKKTPVASFDMVLQRKDLMIEVRQNYKNMLADLATRLHPRPNVKVLRYVEEICDALVTSHAQGEMNKRTFGVKSVCWTDGYMPDEGIECVKETSHNIQLGCR